MSLEIHGFRQAGQRAARRLLNSIEETVPDRSPAAPRIRARALELVGDFPAAEEILRTLAQFNPRDLSLQGHLGVLAARQGHVVEARDLVARIGAAESALPGMSSYWQAATLAWLGDLDLSMTHLQRALASGWPYFGTESYRPMLEDPWLAPLWDEPRFRMFGRSSRLTTLSRGPTGRLSQRRGKAPSRRHR